MSKDSTRIQRILGKLAIIWQRHPEMSFGQLLESLENVAWDGPFPSRDFAPRLAQLPDDWLEHAVNQCESKPNLLNPPKC